MANLERDLPVRFTDGPPRKTSGREIPPPRTPPYTFYIYEDISRSNPKIEDGPSVEPLKPENNTTNGERV